MKKLVSLLLCALLALSLIPAMVLSVSAAEPIVYVNDGGSGDGSSADKPLGSLDAAMKKLATTGGTVAVVSEITLESNFNNADNATVPAAYHAPANARRITITSADASKKALFTFPNDCPDYCCNGVTNFKNIIINSVEPLSCYIEANGFHLTMDEGLEMTDINKSAVAPSTRVCVFGLNVKGNSPADLLTRDSWVTIKSGAYGQIAPRTHNVNDDEGVLTGDAYLELLGDFTVNEIGFATWSGATQQVCSGKNIVTWDCTITLWRMFIGYNYSAKIDTATTIIIGEKAAKEIHPLAGATPQGFCGTAKVTEVNVFYKDGCESAEDLSDELLIAGFTRCFPEIDVLSKYTGILHPTETDVDPIEGGSAPTTDAPTTTAAPTTDAPTTTAAQQGGESTPATGDSLVIIACVALVAALACTVIVKKKVND